MNYAKIYTNLTKQNNRTKRNDGSLESHHIIPKCVGGKNNKENLILLTPREHYLAHWLLIKMYTGKVKALLCYAFFKMCCNNQNQKRTITSRDYDRAKKYMSEHCRGPNHPSYGTKMTDEQRLEI